MLAVNHEVMVRQKMKVDRISPEEIESFFASISPISGLSSSENTTIATPSDENLLIPVVDKFENGQIRGRDTVKLWCVVNTKGNVLGLERDFN
jgi:hypothetical protein